MPKKPKVLKDLDVRPWTYGPITVLGALASKSNGRQISRSGGKTIVRKSDTALQYVDDFLKQVRRPKTAYKGWVKFLVVVYYEDLRRDLDIALLQDMLQKVGIIKNDRQVTEIFTWRRLSKKRPRVVFTLADTDPPPVED